MIIKYTGFFVLFFCFSCVKPVKPEPEPKESKIYTYLSATHKKLKEEYSKEANDVGKEEVLKKYKSQIHHYLQDSIKYFMDSVNVRIKRIKPVVEGVIATEFKYGIMGFDYIINYANKDFKSSESYALVKGLKEGVDTTLNFHYMGELEVNDPTNEYQTTFEIKAMPVPLNRRP